uniref:DNA polymerase kappa n=1 Tax=Lingulaulax polyedra TaxID=160621 RepID=A0A516AG48_LINPO|nr:DNA polymerase kappa [Lingulodinium polyedra]
MAAQAPRDTSHLFVFTGVTANKAGMGADKELVSRFVYERCKSSKYTQRQEDLDAKQQARAEAMAAELRALDARMTPAEHLVEEQKATAELRALEAKRDLSRTHCVVDMDMFYAAVELRDRPDLVQRPVAVGGLGMITTANYVARQYGVRAAMPGFIAVEMVRQPHLVGSKMPPDELVFIPPDFGKYTRAARETREIFREYDPNFHAWSLDEAYMDLTPYLASRGGPEAADAVVAELRRRVKERTGGLTCSAGIGPNPLLAKVCSDDNKPDGQSRIAPTREAVLEYLQDLPIRKISGVGKVLERQVKVMLGVVTCGQLRAAASGVRRAFASRPKTSDFLLRVSLGLSGGEVAEEEGEVIGEVGRKSLSNERTFSPEADPEELRRRLRELCRAVAEDMAAHVPPLAAKAVALKVKTSAFEVRNKERRCPRFVGFDPSFGHGEAPRRSRALQGPGASWKGRDLEGDEAPAPGSDAGDPAASARQAAGEVSAEDAANEAEVARVAEELFALALPFLEEQLPGELRLMGVRVSSFRGAKATLERGQQQLGRFFEAAERPEVPRAGPATCSAGAAGGLASEAEVSVAGALAGGATGGPAAASAPDAAAAAAEPGDEVVEVVDVVEVDDSGDERGPGSGQPPASASRALGGSADEAAGAARSALAGPQALQEVSCPVCGARVALSAADAHVNSHYDQPPTAGRPPAEAAAAARRPGAGSKRKAEEDARRGGQGVLPWPRRPPTPRG